jgi:hypothetical protein
MSKPVRTRTRTPRRISWKIADGPLPPDARRVSAPSVFCNQYASRPDISREEAYRLFKEWLAQDRQREFRNLCRSQLRHMSLACTCESGFKFCHALLLMRVARSPFEP